MRFTVRVVDHWMPGCQWSTRTALGASKSCRIIRHILFGSIVYTRGHFIRPCPPPKIQPPKAAPKQRPIPAWYHFKKPHADSEGKRNISRLISWAEAKNDWQWKTSPIYMIHFYASFTFTAWSTMIYSWKELWWLIVCSVKNCCSECDLLVVCARQAAICAAVGRAPEVPEMLLDTRA